MCKRKSRRTQLQVTPRPLTRSFSRVQARAAVCGMPQKLPATSNGRVSNDDGSPLTPPAKSLVRTQTRIAQAASLVSDAKLHELRGDRSLQAHMQNCSYVFLSLLHGCHVIRVLLTRKNYHFAAAGSAQPVVL